jgi:hypothetical protein
VLGTLELPPCTTVEEWHAFRAGLNQLMYTRYGLTVDDCVPVDLAPQADYAAMLRSRALAPVAAPVPLIIAPPVPQPQAGAVAYVAQDDAAGLRRLFIELPALCSALRLLELPAGVSSFEPHQAILLRLGMATLNASSMPRWAGPHPTSRCLCCSSSAASPILCWRCRRWIRPGLCWLVCSWRAAANG